MKKILALAVVALLCSSEARAQQQSGTPGSIRVLTDANGYLLLSGAIQTDPISQPTQFSNTRLKTDSDGNLLVAVTGGSVSISNLYITDGQITPGTNIAVVNAGEVRTVLYVATVTGITCNVPFRAASTIVDCSIGILPAKTRIVSVYADTTEGWTCIPAQCTGGKNMWLGNTSAEYLANASVATPVFKGDADAELGSLMTRAQAIQGGAWAPGTAVIARFTSGTGNWGNGLVTYINAGSTTFYIETLTLP